LAEVKQAGFHTPKLSTGGVTIKGTWPDVWRANMELRGAGKVLARIGEFRAFHLAQLDKRARKFPWAKYLRPDFSVKVDCVTSRKNKIYHSGAASERIERAIHETIKVPIAKGLEDAQIVLKVRIHDNLVIISVDTSGDGLHKRGHKQAMGKAPLRETMAALVLRACGYKGSEPVYDPMCGSGTFLIEAAEIASGLMPGRIRAVSKDGFAYERLASYDPARVNKTRKNWPKPKTLPDDLRFYGSDRNVKVVGFARENAKRARVAGICEFSPKPISAITCPDGPAVNPPYGARIGKKRDLFALYQSFGNVMRDEFVGWRVGLITADQTLAKATGLHWSEISPPIAHGGLKVKLFQTGPLGH